MRKLLRYGSILLAAGMFLAGCFETDNAPQFEVVVLDPEQQPVPDAYVGLFDNLDAWLARENPVQAWRQTGSDGKVLFVDLDEKEYFIYVRSGLMDNSGNEIRSFDKLEANRKAKIRIHID